jgi:hypothetical protein
MSERLTLLPCPFCGSSAEGDTGFFPLTNLLYVWCSNAECGCSPKGRGERMFLPEEWNHRAALRSPQPAEQQEAVAWTTELALETAKQIGSIGFTVCPENIWGDKGVALTRVRAAQPAEQPNAAQELERIFTQEFSLHSGPEDCPTYYDGCNCCGPDAVRELFKQRDEALAALRTREAQPAEQPNAAQEKLEQSTGAAPRTVFSAESPVAATPQPAEQQAKRYPAGYECDDGRKCLKEDKRECANGCARFPTNGNG